MATVLAFGYNGWHQLQPQAEPTESQKDTLSTTARIRSLPISLPDCHRVLAATWDTVVLARSVAISDTAESTGILELHGRISRRIPWESGLLSELARVHLVHERVLVLTQDRRLLLVQRTGEVYTVAQHCLDVAVSGDEQTVVTIEPAHDGDHDSAGVLYVYNVHTILCMPASKVAATSLPVQGELFVRVAAGYNHFLAQSKRNEVFSWGSARQLGHGDTQDLEQPHVIASLQGLAVTQMACGAFHSAVISDSGDLYTFGWNQYGQLGVDEETNGADEHPSAGAVQLVTFGSTNDGDHDHVDDLETAVVSVACGEGHTVAILSDGSAWSCGWGKYGQLGNGPATGSTQRFARIPLPAVEKGRRAVHCMCGPWTTFITMA
ncbi:regulator of chromosome condensation 1/beta-lactamase-inhibitor protein II [Thamnocephalis sphaerospora]|uniref:Regulator of chromosome condensation 1/beta-lactamase-inhibitor protein II n=1 Tax=Thamnocephalis sphaerospora TaxID=78915 RepID=A0A4P9XHF0_9FUNG|nr:regulator of chromosome condensation 1/beta-lactamase-inhibitor protein II [Thamnocephalis sphaerospora]|eukprot:RKP05068.1 regulator of chromosome condensation 1/beta-lactamase-inhibitor protein II [Thamnocephalis sphaerospora]